jgi:hypothetical protein
MTNVLFPGSEQGKYRVPEQEFNVIKRTPNTECRSLSNSALNSKNK